MSAALEIGQGQSDALAGLLAREGLEVHRAAARSGRHRALSGGAPRRFRAMQAIGLPAGLSGFAYKTNC
jgi:hypothetical protein